MHRERLVASMAALADLAAQGADSQQIATTAVKTWHDIHAALLPVIGPRGVCALYQRSLHQARVDFPWLGPVHATALDSGEFDALRKMEISKLRGQPTLPGLHTFRITCAGIRVFAPPQVEESGEVSAPVTGATRLNMGVPGLDEMMGGGLPSGYSVLVAGPSGSGKSILAAAFLTEGARRKETGVIAAFEQRANKSRGEVIARLIDSGQIGVVDTRSVTVSVDEVSQLLIAEVKRLKATRVVIDSLSGFELALAPTFQENFRESMARMMAALAKTGATVLMTSELEDRYTDLRFSPYGTAFLVDAIIVQRYIEVDSRLQRMMAVVKVRASRHSNELRLFDIDADGIKLGGMLTGQEGLLGGRPTRRGARNESASEEPP